MKPSRLVPTKTDAFTAESSCCRPNLYSTELSKSLNTAVSAGLIRRHPDRPSYPTSLKPMRFPLDLVSFGSRFRQRSSVSLMSRIPAPSNWSAGLRTAWTMVQNMGVDHGRAHVAVSKKLLKCADIVTGFQEMRRK